MHRKVLSITAVLAITLITSTTVFASPSSLQNAKNNEKALETQLENFDNQIQQTALQIQQTNVQITKTENDINSDENEIKRSESNINIEQNQFDQSIRSMYMGGTTSYLDVLLNSNGISDFISRLEIVNKVVQYNNNVISNLNQMKDEIARRESVLKSQEQSLIALKDSCNNKIAQLNKQKAQEEPLLAQAKTTLNNEIALSQTQQVYVNNLAAPKVATPALSVDINRGGNSSNPVVSYALNFRGDQYVYATAGPTTFDCSGLMMYVYSHFGISLPRTSEEQFGVGSAVNENNLQPGDLVFFNNSGGGPGHVGMYIGNGLMIHAPHTGTVVQVVPLADEPNYCGARRVN